jgi:hypothetical protein
MTAPRDEPRQQPETHNDRWFLINKAELSEMFTAWMYSDKSPKRLHEVYDPILARKIDNLCEYCSHPFEKHNLPCPHLMRTKVGNIVAECAHFETRTANTGAQARIDAVVKELEKEEQDAIFRYTNATAMNEETYQQGIAFAYERAIALLKEGVERK